VTAITASRVSPTTGGSFAAATQVYLVWDALNARARQSATTAWIANNSIISKARQFDTTGGSSYWANLNDATPPRLIGKPIFEASSMDSSVTTGSNILLAGNFGDGYLIVDSITGPTLEWVPTVMSTSSGTPTYQSGWRFHHRVGAKVVDTDAFRVIRL
jgi:HK97 family phage major capsid protein